jgi:hypothetical protein
MSARLPLHALIGDLVVFRNLNPVDPAVPGYDEAWVQMGIQGSERPRKQDPGFAQVLAWLVRRAGTLDPARAELSELVYVGDTALSDGTAFRNLLAAGRWRGWAFIGAENAEAPQFDISQEVYSANRWTALVGFAGWLVEQGASLDARTAVILDIDKTALGARGRNDAAIDQARIVAIEATIGETIGAAFDGGRFRRAYSAINRPAYHFFTADNQDFLAYICLVVTAGLVALDTILAMLEAGTITSFAQFIAQVDEHRRDLMGDGLRSIHDQVYAGLRAGDATPFKAFRRREYLETVHRMGCLPDDASPLRRLTEEICLTREVLDFGWWLRGRGCLLMAVSDKPDEASLPTPELAARGYLPLHRTSTHVVGPSIAELLLWR